MIERPHFFLLQPAAHPHGSLTPGRTPLSDAENLFREPGPLQFLLFATLVGSIFNIPIAELPLERFVSHEVIHFFGMRYRVPVVTHWAGTVIAVNVGGAVIPTLMSVYLLIKRELLVKGLIATAVVALVIHWMADPVPGLAIAVPVFMPALVTAVIALLLSRKDAPPLAYIAGGLGTLIGADFDQSRQGTRPRRTCRLDRQRRNVRRHLSYRYPSGAACEPLHATPCTLTTAAAPSLTYDMLRVSLSVVAPRRAPAERTFPSRHRTCSIWTNRRWPPKDIPNP